MPPSLEGSGSRDLQLELREANWPSDLQAAKSLLERYFASLRQHPAIPPVIREKDRRPELEALANRYTDGSAVLYLAFLGEDVCGCAAVHLLPTRQHAAELKRLFVLPEARGCGAGRALIQACAGWARGRGAREILLDTLPEAMPDAVRLYGAAGFEPTECYNENEGCCFAFFRLPLG